MSTSESGQSGGSSVTLDQFIALNDELAALVSAGVPLERGLIEAGHDLRGRLGSITTGLGRRMGDGVSLAEAVATSSSGMPNVYRAVVEAGVRSGRLATALEGMASIARGYTEARRAFGVALLYPLFVLGLAYGLGLFFLIQIAPRFASAFQSLGLAPLKALDVMARIGGAAIYWGPILPFLLFLGLIRWAWSGRSLVFDAGPFGPVLNKFPMVGSMMANFRAANFAKLLSLLIEHHVPLDEAVRLAGDASGDREFRASAEQFANSIRRGENAGVVASPSSAPFPPLLRWMLTAGHRQADLGPALGHLADNYRDKANTRAELLGLALPSLGLLVIGVGAVLVYAMLLFVPLMQIWDGLALPVNR